MPSITKTIRIAKPVLRVFIGATRKQYRGTRRYEVAGKAFDRWVEGFQAGKFRDDSGLFSPCLSIPATLDPTTTTLPTDAADRFDSLALEIEIPPSISAPRWACRNDALLRFAIATSPKIDGTPTVEWAAKQIAAAHRRSLTASKLRAAIAAQIGP